METNIIGKTILETNISQTSFFIGKSTKKNLLIKKKVSNNQLKAYKKYTTGTYRQKNNRQRGIKTLPRPHLEPNQSKKLIKELGPSSIHNLV